MATRQIRSYRDWEATFRGWSKPGSDSEQQKMENAERMIGDAIRADATLARMNIEVFAQGSYKNNTNVCRDSDVDICVRCMSTLFDDYSMSDGLSRSDTGIVPSEYTFPQFKNDVHRALVAKFGPGGINRGNKAFDIHANSYRIAADVVPTFEHRRYFRNSFGLICYYSGTEFSSDTGQRVINWPHEHYQNGVSKNVATGNRFKYITRVLKCLRNEMADAEIQAAKPIPSYLVECLAWNVPNEAFGHDSYIADVRYSLAHLFNNTMTDAPCFEWGEVNELKYLFRFGQPWNRLQAHQFLSAAWDYIGFD